MVDKRLIGILAVAFILSSGAVSFIIGERVDEPIEILNDEWNIPRNSRGDLELPTIEGRYTYSFGLVVRKPIRRLELLFATVQNSSFEMMPNMSTGGPPTDLFYGIDEVGKMTSVIEDYASSSGARLEKLGFHLDTPAGEYEGLVVDLTDPIRPVAPDAAQSSLPTVHTALLNSTGHVSQYYRGFPDFYLNRERALIDITIQHNQNVTKFSQRTTQQGTSLLMGDAPPTGRLVFDDLRKEDQVFVTIAIDSSRPELLFVVNPAKEAAIHLALVFIDGEYYEGLATLFYR
jgi:hypothetical protein